MKRVAYAFFVVVLTEWSPKCLSGLVRGEVARIWHLWCQRTSAHVQFWFDFLTPMKHFDLSMTNSIVCVFLFPTVMLRVKLTHLFQIFSAVSKRIIHISFLKAIISQNLRGYTNCWESATFSWFFFVLQKSSDFLFSSKHMQLFSIKSFFSLKKYFSPVIKCPSNWPICFLKTFFNLLHMRLK